MRPWKKLDPSMPSLNVIECPFVDVMLLSGSHPHFLLQLGESRNPET